MDYRSTLREIRHSDVLELERLGKSDRQIAFHYGISAMGFGKIRRRMGWVREHDWERVDKGVARKGGDEKRENRNKYMRGYNRSNGIKRNSVRVGKKTVQASRLVAEEALLGRGLLDGEVVHHVNEDSLDDSPENLWVFASQGDHMAYHRGESVKVVAKYKGRCHFCNKYVTLSNYGIFANGKYICRECLR